MGRRAVPLVVVQGSPFHFSVRVRARDENEVLAPMDLTNALIRLQARPNTNSDKLYLDLSSDGDGISKDPGTPGAFYVDLSGDDVSALNWDLLGDQVGIYRCAIVRPNELPIPIFQGTIKFKKGAIR